MLGQIENTKYQIYFYFNCFSMNISFSSDEEGFEKVNYKCLESRNRKIFSKSKELEGADVALQKKR